MIGVGALVIVHPVTSITCCWCALKPIGMATETIYSVVCTGERECGGIVIEGTISFACRVTGQTGRIRIGISGHTHMLFICFGIGMTGDTSIFFKICRIGVAIHTLIPFAFVRTTIDREIQVVMIER